jgi:Flp pilus assembly pilin Flp
MDSDAGRDWPTTRDLLQAFFADRRASFPVQYAVVVAISGVGVASALVMRAIGNEIAARFEAINAALSKAMSGTPLH